MFFFLDPEAEPCGTGAGRQVEPRGQRKADFKTAPKSAEHANGTSNCFFLVNIAVGAALGCAFLSGYPVTVAVYQRPAISTSWLSI